MEIKNIFERAKEGDKSSKNTIFKEFYTPIFRYTRMRVKNKEDAEDLTQTIFLKLFSNIKNMTPVSPKALLFTIARNTVIDYWRTRKMNLNIDDHLDTLFSEDKKNSPSEHRELLKAMSELSQSEQEIIELIYFSDLDTKTISTITSKAEDNIRQIKSRSLKKLKTILENNELAHEERKDENIQL